MKYYWICQEHSHGPNETGMGLSVSNTSSQAVTNCVSNVLVLELKEGKRGCIQSYPRVMGDLASVKGFI